MGAVDQFGQRSLQPHSQRGRREEVEPGRGQLDRQRQPVEPANDVGDGGGVGLGQAEVGIGVLSPPDEQVDRGGGGQLSRIIAGVVSPAR